MWTPAILEIKGVRGPVKRDDVRQLRQWTDDAAANEQLQAEGLLIANGFASTPPRERGPVLSGDTLKLATRWDQCVVTTSRLFVALVDQQNGSLNERGFWDSLLQTAGLSGAATFIR